MNKTKGNLVLIGEATETGWDGDGDKGRLRWLAGGGDRRILASWPVVEMGGYG